MAEFGYDCQCDIEKGFIFDSSFDASEGPDLKFSAKYESFYFQIENFSNFKSYISAYKKRIQRDMAIIINV